MRTVCSMRTACVDWLLNVWMHNTQLLFTEILHADSIYLYTMWWDERMCCMLPLNNVCLCLKNNSYMEVLSVSRGLGQCYHFLLIFVINNPTCTLSSFSLFASLFAFLFGTWKTRMNEVNAFKVNSSQFCIHLYSSHSIHCEFWV